MEEVLSGEGGLRKTRFRFDHEYEIVVKQWDIAQEKADGVIMPLNTAFAVGGSSASVLYAVDQARSNTGDVSKNIYEILFPSLNILNPISLSPGQVVIDLEDRPKVSEKGAAIISESIRAAGIPLRQEWDRIIVAFIRDQGEDLSEEDITMATRSAIAEAERNQLGSVVAVPFGTGILGIPAKKSASLMVPAVLEYLRSSKPRYLKKITFIMDLEGQYYQFAQETRLLMTSFQKGGLEEQIQEIFLQRQYEIQA